MFENYPKKKEHLADVACLTEVKLSKGSELKIHTGKGKIDNLKEKGNNNDDNRIEI